MTTETKFTPGPWTNHGRIPQPGLPHSAVAAKTLIARVYSEACGDEEQEAANAHLISAAPELYEALEEYFQAYDENPHLGPRGSKVDKAFVKARAALSKARGGS